MSLKISWFRVFIATFLMCSLVVIALVGSCLKTEDALKVYLDLFSAFVASLFGALAAFSLQEYREKMKESKHELGEINLLILGFILRLDSLREIKKILIDPVRNEHARQLLIRPATVPWPSYEVNYPDLSGLLGEGLGGHVVRIAMLDQKYNLARKMVESHGSLHLEYQEIMSKSGIKSATDKQIREMIGEKLWQSLELSGNNVVETVDEIFNELKLFLEEFPREFKKRHKNFKVIAYFNAGPDATGSGML